MTPDLRLLAAAAFLLAAAATASGCSSSTPAATASPASAVPTFGTQAGSTAEAEPTASAPASEEGPGSASPEAAVPAIGGQEPTAQPSSPAVQVPRLDIAAQAPELRDFVSSVNGTSVSLEKAPEPASGEQVDAAYAGAWEAIRAAGYGVRALIPQEWVQEGEDPDSPQPAFILAITAPDGREYCAVDVTYIPASQQTPDELASDGQRAYPYLGLLDGSCDMFTWGDEAR